MNFQEEIIGKDIGVVKSLDGIAISTRIAGSSVIATTEQSTIVNNKHIFVQIPLGFGKAWNKRKSTQKIFGGLTYNLSYNFTGSFIDDDRNLINLNRKENPETYERVFNNTAGLGIWFGGEYSRSITDKLSWSVAPRFQLPISALTTKNFGFTQRYYTLNLAVGINYRLTSGQSK